MSLSLSLLTSDYTHIGIVEFTVLIVTTRSLRGKVLPTTENDFKNYCVSYKKEGKSVSNLRTLTCSL